MTEHSAVFPGPCVVISGAVASWLWKAADLRSVERQARDAHPEAVAALIAIRQASLSWNQIAGSVTGSSVDKKAEVSPQLTYANVSHAATALGITDRAVRLRCQKGQLSAELVEGRWRIDAAHLERLARRAS